MNKRRILFGVIIPIAALCLIAVIWLVHVNNQNRFNSSYQIETQYIEQPVNHFNPGSEKFRQEIIILTPEGATSQSPVFFIIGNEGDSTAETLIDRFKTYGCPSDIIFLAAEHRGYGQSITENPDQSCPEYVRIDQALADYHDVVLYYRSQYSGPWMAVGYSYGGGLAVNFAYQYPEDISVVLGSSAVVKWPFFMDQYDKQVKNNLGLKLYARMSDHINSLQPQQPFDDIWMEREFLHTMVVGICQTKGFQSLMPLFRAASILSTKQVLGFYHFLDNSFADGMAYQCAKSFGTLRIDREVAVTGNFNMYTWKYQQATETGTHWISEEAGGIFPKSRDDIINECSIQFGEEPQALTNPEWNPSAMIDLIDVPQIYTIGGHDPWKALCLEPDYPLENGKIFYYSDGFHCPERETAEHAKEVLETMLYYSNF